MELERPGLGLGHRAQVVDEPAEDPGLLEDRREVLGVGRVDPVDERLDVALDHRQRRSQLVADVGHAAIGAGARRPPGAPPSC